MKKRSLRILGIALALLMIVTIIAGCGKASPTPAGPAATPTPGSTADPSEINYPKEINPSKENWNGKTLSIYGGAAPEDVNSRGYALTTWFQENFGVKFEYPSTGADATTKLTMLVATNQAPTVISDDNTVMPLYAARGLIQPVDQYINDQDTVFVAEVFDAYQWKGQRYCMQWSSWSTFRSVIYNQDSFKNAGLEDPWTRFKDEGEYSMAQLFTDSEELRQVNEAGEIVRSGWNFTDVDVGFLLALNDAEIFTQTTVNGTEKFTLQQDNIKVQHTLQLLDDGVQSNKIDYNYAALADLLSGKRAMYNQVFERAYRLRVDQNNVDCPPFAMVPLPNGEDAQGDFRLGLVPWFNGLIGMRTENPDLGYFWTWMNGDEVVSDAVIGEKDTVGGLKYPADRPTADPDPDVIAQRWPEDIRDGYFFLKDVRAGKEGYQWVIATNVEGVPGFTEQFQALCNDVYRDRGSLPQVLTALKAPMQAALDKLPDTTIVRLPVEPKYPTISFAGGMPATIVPAAGLADIGASVSVVNGALVISLPNSIPEEVDEEGATVQPYVDLFYIKGDDILFPGLTNTNINVEYTCESGGYDVVGFEVCYVTKDGEVIDNRVLMQSMEDSGTGAVPNWVFQNQDLEEGMYLAFRVAAYEKDGDGNPISIKFALNSITFSKTELSVDD